MRIQNKTEHYLHDLIPDRKPYIHAMESYAAEHGVPIMELTGIQMLLQLLELHHAKKVLEIGTAIGYSAIRMADHIGDLTVVTIERDQERADIAKENIRKMKLQDRILTVLGDALDLKETVATQGPYDVLFIDAAKGNYKRFFELYEPLVKAGGIIIADNVLFKGMVAGVVEEIPKRLHPMVQKLRRYNSEIMRNERFSSMIYPIGDGVMVSIKH
ncbi:Predicted O-methyltransferase YrrM [Evansella caseinilytica]|uniref:tRNA 5-hydroxyuridine methyltransferase n=1 Tax=Evansella caseinilytica TaxID=1503961 RepID=A0A1H3KA83_9BACI|nr:O-methyltransferase [Evansella caseinilytica]SDY49096.1 Predicted O-methyltransferase YrrM [Evansella caseinilytica]